MALDLSANELDLDTPRDGGHRGDAPRTLGIKVNDAWEKIQNAFNENVGAVGGIPTVTFPYMLWVDTTVSPAMLRRRNADDTGWVEVGEALFNPQAAIEAVNAKPTGYKNKLINGRMDVWQRSSAQTGIGVRSADRWASNQIGSTQVVSRQAFAPGQTEVPGDPAYYHRTAVTSVVGAGNYSLVLQNIENVRTLAGGTATFSFWARADVPRNIAIELNQSFGFTGSPSPTVLGIGTQQIALTASWAKYTVTVSIPSIAGKTLGAENTHFLRLILWFEAGADFAARSSNIGQQSGTFDFTMAQFEEGDTATGFEQRHITQELELCLRYCRVYGGDNTSNLVGWGQAIAATVAQIHTPIGLMRATPTIAMYGAVGTLGLTRADGSAVTVTALDTGTLASSRQLFRFVVSVPSGLVAGHACSMVIQSDSAFRLILDAEL